MSTLLVGLSQRSTKITAVNTEDGSIIKTFTNCKVNYNQKEFDQLKVHVGRCLRLSAKDPNYDVKKMSFKVEGGEIDLNVKALEDLRNGTPLPLFFSSPSQCIHLIVHVLKLDELAIIQTRTPSRARSIRKDDIENETPIRHSRSTSSQQEDQENFVDNIDRESIESSKNQRSPSDESQASVASANTVKPLIVSKPRYPSAPKHRAGRVQKKEDAEGDKFDDSSSSMNTTTPSRTKVSRKAPTPKFGSPALKPSSSSLLDDDPTPLYGTGLTAGEVASAYNQSIRSFDTHSQAGSHARTGAQKTPGSTRKGKSVTSPDEPGGKKGHHKGGAGGEGSMGGDGRPSLGTMTVQWEFMRSNFIKGGEDELEWLMVAKKPGAYKYAHKKFCTAEDKYYKSLTDIFEGDRKMALLASSERRLCEAIATIASAHRLLQAVPSSEEGIGKVESGIQAMQTVLPPSSFDDPSSLMRILSEKTQKSLKLMYEENLKLKVARLAKDLDISSELNTVRTDLKLANQESDAALKEMERWMQREGDTVDYAQCMREQEAEWLDKEADKNREALQMMRTFIPARIAEMSTDALKQEVAARDGLYSYELLAEIKKNKMLHWIVTHPDDIMFSNFLAGDMKQYFENLDQYDVTELRAVALCLPEKFELDGDGKKMEWRKRLMARVKALAAQENREMTQGGWDIALNKRAMVQLPALKVDQQRRPVYFHRTKKQSDIKLKQYKDKQASLEKKQALLVEAEAAAVEAKKEYDIILTEMRDPDFKAQYGMEQLTAVKEIAKNQLSAADEKRKGLRRDVDQLIRTIQSNPISFDDFVASIGELETFLQSHGGIDWTQQGDPIAITGVFEAEPVINKIERAAAKFMTAEEEAALRKAEIDSLKTMESEVVAPVPTPPDAIATDDIECEVGAAEINLDSRRGSSIVGASGEGPSSTNEGGRGEDQLLIEPGATIAAVEPDVDSTSATTVGATEVQPSTPLSTPKKSSVLARANPEMLSCLNRIFSPNGKSTPGRMTTRAMSVMSPMGRGNAPSTGSTQLRAVAGAVVDVVAPALVKKSQSKLLGMILGGSKEGETKAASSLSSGPPVNDASKPLAAPSFLDQIKFGKKKVVNSDVESAQPEKPSFLDAIKARMKRE